MVYDQEDLCLLIEMLSASKSKCIKRLKSHISFEREFDRLSGGNPNEKIQEFLSSAFSERLENEWPTFLFDKPLEDMPLYINAEEPARLFALWRMKIGK